MRGGSTILLSVIHSHWKRTRPLLQSFIHCVFFWPIHFYLPLFFFSIHFLFVAYINLLHVVYIRRFKNIVYVYVAYSYTVTVFT